MRGFLKYILEIELDRLPLRIMFINIYGQDDRFDDFDSYEAKHRWKLMTFVVVFGVFEVAYFSCKWMSKECEVSHLSRLHRCAHANVGDQNKSSALFRSWKSCERIEFERSVSATLFTKKV